MHVLSIKLLKFFRENKLSVGVIPEQPFFRVNFDFGLNPLEKIEYSACVDELVDAGLLGKGAKSDDIWLTMNGVHFVYGPDFSNHFSQGVATAMVQNFNFHGTGHNIQIGDGNTQQIVNAMTTLAKAINDAEVPEDQKKEAKSVLTSLLSNPTVLALVGPAIEGVKALLS